MVVDITNNELSFIAGGYCLECCCDTLCSSIQMGEECSEHYSCPDGVSLSKTLVTGGCITTMNIVAAVIVPFFMVMGSIIASVMCKTYRHQYRQSMSNLPSSVNKGSVFIKAINL